MACFSVWDIQGCGCGGGGGVNCVTCGSSGIPNTLSITDANGTYTATWNPTISLWITPQLCSASVSQVANCNSGTAACKAGSNTAGALYVYSIGCTSANHMTLNRYWYELTCISPSWQYAPCSCGTGAGVQVYSSSGSVAVTCGSVSWSGTLTKITGNKNDPVGGTTSFTQ